MERASKYHAKKTVIDGITFDSKKEASRYSELKLLEKAGEISDLHLQPEFLLQPGFRSKSGHLNRPIRYVADFIYTDKEGNEIVEDVKGMQTEVFKIKRKLFEAKFTEFIFKIV